MDGIASLLEMLVGVMSTVEEGPLRLSVEALVREVAWMRLVLRGLVDDVADARRRRENPGGQHAGVPRLAGMSPSALHHLETTLARALGGAREDMSLAELVRAALEAGREAAAVGADVAGNRAPAPPRCRRCPSSAAPGLEMCRPCQDEHDGVKPVATDGEGGEEGNLIRDPVDCEDCGGDGCSRCEESGLICNTCGKAMPRCQCTEEAHEPGEPEFHRRLLLDEATEEEHRRAVIEFIKASGWPRGGLSKLICGRMGKSRFKRSTFETVMARIHLTEAQWELLETLGRRAQPALSGWGASRPQSSLVAKGFAEYGRSVAGRLVVVTDREGANICRITDAGRERLSLGRGPRSR